MATSLRRRIVILIGSGALSFAVACAETYQSDDSTTNLAGQHVVPGGNFFYDDLSPYGSWVSVAPYGWCWTPYDSNPDWRPYWDGYWAYTDYGWSWVSNEPFGWATYHYGRWYLDSLYGWVWVPGSVWAPAWVAWHCDRDWMGWAPLPPEAGWDASVGLRFQRVDEIEPSRWCFVDRRHFSDVKMRATIVSPWRNGTLLKRTRDMTRYEIRDGKPFNDGFDVREVERMNGNHVHHLTIAAGGPPRRGWGEHVQGSVMRIYRPQVTDEKASAPPLKHAEVRQGATTDPETLKQFAKSRDGLERSIEARRVELQREHQEELRKNGTTAQRNAELLDRHAQEMQALEKQAQEQRQTLLARQQMRISRPTSEAKQTAKTLPGPRPPHPAGEPRRKGE